MLKNQLIPIIEVLFVFEKWTLMVNSKFSSQLKIGMEALLFDDQNEKVGTIKLSRFLQTRNPEINPIEVALIDVKGNMKDAKLMQPLNN